MMMGPAKWAALDARHGVQERLSLYIAPEIASGKEELLKDICAVSMGQAASVAQELLREKGMDSFVVVTTSGPQPIA
jgi:hypothetical protein